MFAHCVMNMGINKLWLNSVTLSIFDRGTLVFRRVSDQGSQTNIHRYLPGV